MAKVKGKKGLLFSLLTLMIALAITATATYAWFVVNKEVTASNMQVTVRSDTTYLVIKKSATAITTTSDLGTGTSESLDASDAQVLPVMYDEEETGSGVIKWKTANGQSYTNGAAQVDEGDPVYTSISQADVTSGKYFVKYTFYVGLTPTTALPATHLRVKSLAVTANSTTGGADTFKPAVSAMVQCTQATESVDTCLDFPSIDGKSGTYYSDQVDLAATVALNTVYTIDVYVYINGDDAVVKSQNTEAAKLGGFKVALTLEVTPGAYSA